MSPLISTKQDWQEGLDYFDTYFTRITSVRMILAIAALRNLEVHHMDVKMRFLNEDLEKVLYMNQPEGFMAPILESKVCKGVAHFEYSKNIRTLNLARFLNETTPQVEPPKEGQPSNAQATMTAKELWESLECKYKTKDAGTKKFYRNLVEFL
ncbi:calcineurin B-like protein 4 [Tanacetum coccineum]